MSKITHHFGALNSKGRYVLPSQTNKYEEHTCWDCNEPLILKCGEIRVWHFCHYPNSRCQSYTNPTESETHKHAKEVLKLILENKLKFEITHTCRGCHNTTTQKSSTFQKDGIVVVEKSFTYRGCTRRADVAIWNELRNVPYCIFEIYHTHKTDMFYRPPNFWDLKPSDIFEVYDRTKQVIQCHKPLCSGCNNDKVLLRCNKEIIKYRNEITDRVSKWRKRYEESLSKMLDKMSLEVRDVLNRTIPLDESKSFLALNESNLNRLIKLQRDINKKLPLSTIEITPEDDE